MNINKKQIQSVLMLLGSASLFSLGGVFARFMGEGFGLYSQMLVRSMMILGIFFVYSIVSKDKKWKKVEKKDVKWFVLRSLAGVAIMLVAFISFSNLSLGIVYFFLYSASTVVSFMLGRILFGEKLNLIKIISLVVIVVGILLVYSIDIDIALYPYLITSVISGGLIGFVNTSSKKLSDRYSVVQVTSTLLITACVVGLAGMIVTSEPLPAFSMPWLWISIFAITELTGTVLMILGYKGLEAQVASAIMPMEIVFGVIWGILVFQERMPWVALVGGFLIFSATILSALGNGKGK